MWRYGGIPYRNCEYFVTPKPFSNFLCFYFIVLFFFYFTVHLSSCIEREILLVLLNKN